VIAQGRVRRWSLRATSLAGAALLAGCASAPEGYRDTTVPIGQTIRYTPQALAGPWIVQASLGAVDATAFVFDESTRQLQSPTQSLPVGPGGQVVMWLDADGRTAVTGTADGQTALVLDRAATISPDRYSAAVEVLDFYGWDVSRLERVK
jgi:apolipoprotein D and lipocalin family protein